ncbi:hypothetical protein ABZ438_10375 [Streptomyces sp. NPDC005786]|uniref:hypothetical protein n=1 Tax=Streptomyces sp. NPDC005786 TaxID=3154891 RepID=UPI0033E200CE
MTTTPSVPPQINQHPAPAPAAPPASPAAAPASQLSVRCLWGAVITLAAANITYLLHEHPMLTEPINAMGTLVAAAVAVGAWLVRR